MSIILTPRPGDGQRAVLAIFTAFSVTAVCLALANLAPASPPARQAVAGGKIPVDSEADVGSELEEAQDNDARNLVDHAFCNYDEALKVAESATVDRTLLCKRVLLRDGDFSYRRGYYYRAAHMLKRAALIGALERPDKIKLAQSLYACGETERALVYFRQVFDSDMAGANIIDSVRDSTVDERCSLVAMYLMRGDVDKVKELYDQQVHCIISSAAPASNCQQSEKIISLRLEQASIFMQEHDPSAAVKILKKEFLASIIREGELAPATCKIRSQLARAYLQNREERLAVNLYQQLIRDHRNTPDEANALGLAADFYWQARKINAGEKALRKAIALRLAQYGRSSDMVLTLEKNLGTVLLFQGRLAEAENVSLRHEEAISKAKDVDLEGLYTRLYQAGQTAECIDLCKRIIARDERDLQAASSDDDRSVKTEILGQQLERLAEIYCEQGDFKTGCALLERDYKLRKLQVGSVEKLATVYLHMGQTIKAEQLYKEFCVLAETDQATNLEPGAGASSNVAGYRFIASVRTDLAKFYFDHKRWKEAETILTHLMSQLSDNKMSATATFVISAGNLAQVYLKEGRYFEAIKLLKELHKESLAECSDETGHDLAGGFKTGDRTVPAADLGSDSGSHKYLTKSNEPRIDPLLTESLWTSAHSSRRWQCHFFADYWQAEYSQSIPMVNFYSPWQGDKKVLSAATFVALAKAYKASGQPDGERREISRALANIKKSIGRPADLSFEVPYNGYEAILKRIPKSPETVSLLTEVEVHLQIDNN